MLLFETCIKLAAYLVCIGVALEFSHRLYWSINNWVISLDISALKRSAISTCVACIPLVSTLVITMLFTVLLDNRSLLSLGLHYDGESFTKVANGAAIALGCLTTVFLLGILLGHIGVKRSRLSEDRTECLPLFLGGLIDFFNGAVFEEIIFRGYIYYVLYEAAGSSVAIVASSIIFSLAHLIKHPHTPIIFTLNAFIFGILAAISRHFTGSLWLPMGLHFGWNVVSGPILGLPYSGRDYNNGVVISEVSGPLWLTGGRYSLDAGALGTLALVIAAAGLLAVTPIP